MNDTAQLVAIFGAGVILTLITGFYCIVTTRNLIRTLIGLELLSKGVTLLLILAGNAAGRIGLAQSLAITLIIVEVAVIVVAVSVVLGLHQHHNSVDASLIRNLKG